MTTEIEVSTVKEDEFLDIIQKKIKNHKNEVNNKELAFLGNRIRQHIVDMVYTAQSGHPGGAIGLADIYSTLFFKIMNYSVLNPSEKDDVLLISNGHTCAVRYSSMALAGYLEESELKNFRKLGSRLQGHPSTKYFPEVQNSGGSLGQGLAQAGGFALAQKLDKNNRKIFISISDGECQEGMTWESVMSIGHYKLENVIAFADFNNIQIDGFIDEVMSIGDMATRFENLGWLARTVDGHNYEKIISAFEWAKEAEGKPKIIVFKTILGKDVSYMENNPGWHGKPPSLEQKNIALRELKSIAEKLM